MIVVHNILRCKCSNKEVEVVVLVELRSKTERDVDVEVDLSSFDGGGSLNELGFLKDFATEKKQTKGSVIEHRVSHPIY